MRIHFHNKVPGPCVVHQHGLHVPEKSDGHPRYAIDQEQSYTYDFQVHNRAGTYWYHSHTHLVTGHRIYYGLAGLLFELPVAARAYRLRILNGSNSRVYKLAWSDGTPLTVIGTDGGLLEHPKHYPYVTLAPAERLEIWADFSGSKDSEVKLQSLPFSGVTPHMGMGRGSGMGRDHGRGRHGHGGGTLPNLTQWCCFLHNEVPGGKWRTGRP